MTLIVKNETSGATSIIKSIQRGVTVTSTNSVTISEVDLSKTFVSSSFKSGNQTGSAASVSAAASLLNSTTLQIHIGSSGGNSGITNYPTSYWEVVEYV
jgi:hypothetical protein